MKNHAVYYFKQVNIKPLEGSDLLVEHKDAEGAYLSCVSSGASKDEALKALVSALEEDCYQFLSVEDIQEFSNVEWPSVDDEIYFKALAWEAIADNAVGYGAFNCYFEKTH